MKDIIFEKEYSVNSINININKRLGLFGMLGILQDVSTIHAEVLDLGFEFMEKNNSFWVLTQQKLKMNTWPKWQDILTIKTWPRGSDGLKANRDFEIFLEGQKIGECVTTYMVIDGHTRRPVRADLGEEVEKSCPKDVLDFIPIKVHVPEEARVEKTIEVRNSDLDMNNHVNNTKYSQWILDTIPLQYHRSVKVLEF
ncbi:acyl-[acyl-carrier-protein] thioesterase, partial [Halobacteriovorax sp.]|uniref:acyl-[acyl-carrier-protein] thioesterase n=1 Tax=Halobacteriovorax sp. TaxID=2020862 RepID=UPI003565F4F8